MENFSGFLHKKERDNKKHLGILKEVLTKAGFHVSDNLKDIKEPYIFVHKPDDADPIIENLSFEGVRIYTRGKDIVCYRAVNKENTEPFGTAYQLEIKSIFKDIVKEEKKELVGRKIIHYIIEELKNFFIQSAKAEKEMSPDAKDSKYGAAVIGDAARDFASMVTDPRNFGSSTGR